MYSQFLDDAPAAATPIDPTGSWGRSSHLWSRNELDALAVAGFSGRPLLVKGEPGTGKSQIARAAAALLGWRFDYEVITPRFEPQDLLWRYDAVRRLAASSHGDLGPDLHFVTPGVMWRAIDPQSATCTGSPRQAPAKIDDRPCVVLIDEIDKADADLPNSLLEVLGNRAFKTPWQAVPERASDASRGLLVVISSNDERELPLAFLRRCVVLDLVVPDEGADDGRFERWLVERGHTHFNVLGGQVLEDAAALVRRDRIASPPGLGPRPGLAEYLDLLRAVHEICQGSHGRGLAADPAALLRRLSPYVLRKQGQSQAVAAPHPPPAAPGE